MIIKKTSQKIIMGITITKMNMIQRVMIEMVTIVKVMIEMTTIKTVMIEMVLINMVLIKRNQKLNLGY